MYTQQHILYYTRSSTTHPQHHLFKMSSSSSSLVNLLPQPRHVSSTARLLKPTTQAIPLLDSDLAKYYSLAHTGQLLVYYYLRSTSLIADPLTTMMQDILPLAMSQCLFCAVCLPSVGSWYSGTDAGEVVKGSATGNAGKSGKGHGSRRKAGRWKDGGGSWAGRILVGLCCAWVGCGFADEDFSRHLWHLCCRL